eukprot:4790029-Alexandrium_andersonii.AAC.1
MSLRTRAWSPPGGRAAVQRIASALKPSFTRIAIEGGILYPSDDMRKGMRPASLLTYATAALLRRVQLDTRGGFFAQGDVEQAVTELIDGDPGAELAIEAAVGRRGYPDVKKLIRNYSYELRVMLAHVRLRAE